MKTQIKRLEIIMIMIISIILFAETGRTQPSCISKAKDSTDRVVTSKNFKDFTFYEVDIKGGPSMVHNQIWYIVAIRIFVDSNPTFNQATLYSIYYDVKARIEFSVKDHMVYQNDFARLPGTPSVVFMQNGLSILTCNYYYRFEIRSTIDTTMIKKGDCLKIAKVEFDLVGPGPSDRITLKGGPENSYFGKTIINGIDENPIPEVKVFPNPFSDVINVNSDNIQKITIRDVLGKIVYEGKEKEIETLNWKKGIYLIYFNNIFYKKIIKI